MNVSFVYPDALWSLLALLPVWGIAHLAPSPAASWQRWISLIIRTLIVLLLVGALAGAQIVQTPGFTTTIFLLDGSDSIALSQRARAEAFIVQALATMPPDDQSGVVVFGREALVERMPSPERTFGALSVRPSGSATGIANALQLGMALLPAEGYRRLVLLSDGGENRGSVREVAQRAAAAGIPVDVVPLSGVADGLDAQIVGVTLPSTAREGQRLPLRVDLESNATVTGRLIVTGPDGGRLAIVPVDIGADRQTLSILLPEAPTGFNRYTVRLDIPGDTRTQNNAVETFSVVKGKPRVLLVAQSPDDAVGLEHALRAAQIDVAVVAPAAMPDTLPEMSRYDAIALVNVPRRAFSESTLQRLATYVHDRGGGLLMAGGPQSFGPGGWRDTPVEAALPVTMDIPVYRTMPPVSVVIVIDISGSMAMTEEGVPKLSLALDGVRRIASLLRDEDELTILPFDDGPGVVVGPLPGSQRDRAVEQMSRVRLGGSGINIHDALVAAARYVRASDRPVRHIITITDGNDTTQQEGALDIVRALRDEQVVLTSIAVGQGIHVPFIRDMALAGGGRTFLAERAADLPDLLMDEVQTVIQPSIIEGDVTPLRGVPHPAIRSIDTVPDLYGYVLTTPRDTAQVVLVTPEGDALMAAWQYGLGRSIAWTSDFGGRWGKQWVAWERFPQFAAHLFNWLLPLQTDNLLSIETHPSGDTLTIETIARMPDGAPWTGLLVSGRLMSASGEVIETALREVSPGRYRAAPDGIPSGAYLVQVIAHDRQGALVAAITGGAVMPLSAEYRSQMENRSLLEEVAQMTGGRLDPQPRQVFERSGAAQGTVRDMGLPLIALALILLPLDIAVRRFPIRRGGMVTVLRKTGLSTLTSQFETRATSVAAPFLPSHSRSRSNPTDEAQANPSAELERLRAAQEAARRRLRGEDADMRR
ncbi:MAG: VWA domain-containing protein [Roseiflexus sp.]